MTIIPWPSDRKVRHARVKRQRIVDPLPLSVLHQLVADLPGPRDETEAQRAVRFDAQLAEVLSHKPRDAAEAMIAANAVLLRVVAGDAHRDAARPGLGPDAEKKNLRSAKQFEKLAGEMIKALTQRQAHTLAPLDPAMFEALGLGQFLIPDPDDPALPWEAVSAIIVALHPAPKMLQ